MWWTNGGPGCSGSMATILEHGPVRVDKDLNLTLNPNTWHHQVNIVYVDQPAGVGFSQFDGESDASIMNDDDTSSDNLDFIIQFMQRHPELKQNEFYVAAESYGGHYIPTLTKKILL